tara:strand:+ start:132 stop:428 length:297 start_codon:yes stop_codon:yes gene_type:complete
MLVLRVHRLCGLVLLRKLIGELRGPVPEFLVVLVAAAEAERIGSFTFYLLVCATLGVAEAESVLLFDLVGFEVGGEGLVLLGKLRNIFGELLYLRGQL